MLGYLMATVPTFVLIPCLLALGSAVGISCMIVPSRTDGFLSRISYFMNYELPSGLRRLCFAIPGGERVYNGGRDLFHWVAFKPNPLLQMVYFGLVCGGYVLMTQFGFPKLPNAYMGEIHIWLGSAVVAITMYSWYLACTKSAGVITHDNWEQFDNYPYDEQMYGPGQFYVYEEKNRPRIPKLARSKHDAITDKVYAKFDHFCPWLNNAVGEQNYRFFIWFLMMTECTLAYGTAIAATVLLSIIDEEQLLEAEFHNRMTGERVKASYRIVFQWLMLHHSPLMMLLHLCGVMGFVVFLFTCYHVYLASSNTTTNETFKWSSFKNYWDRIQRRKAAKRDAMNGTKSHGGRFRCCVCFNMCCGKEDDGYEPCPPNIYDLGAVKNMKSVLYPISLYRPKRPVKSRYTDLKEWDRLAKEEATRELRAKENANDKADKKPKKGKKTK